MGYIEQMNEWLNRHKDATAEDAYKAGYMQCTDNWCRGERFVAIDSRRSVATDIDEARRLYDKYKDRL